MTYWIKDFTDCKVTVPACGKGSGFDVVLVITIIIILTAVTPDKFIISVYILSILALNSGSL